MSAAGPHPCGCRCAFCLVEVALILARRGRAAAAAKALEELPAALEAARSQGYVAGRRAKQAEIPKPASPPVGASGRPGFRRQAAELVDHVDRLGLTRTAELLAVRVSDMPALLEGRAGLPKSRMDRLRRAS